VILRNVLIFVLMAGSACTLLQGQADSATAPQTQPAQPAASPAQAPPPTGANPDAATKPASSNEIETGKPIKADSVHAQRKAAKLYLQGVRLLKKQQPQPAWNLLKQAAELEPTNATYVQAAELARQSAVTQLVQQASRERVNGAGEDSAKLLKDALAIDPNNPLVVEHMDQLADKTAAGKVGTTVSATPGPEIHAASEQDTLADGPIVLEPKQDKHSFHVRSDSREILQDVFRAYGVEASIHDSVPNQQVRLDVDNVSFPEAAKILGMLTQTFYEPLDPHRVVVAKDTRANRLQFERMQTETVYLPGLNDKEMTEVGTLAKNVFDAQQSSLQPTAGTMTLRVPARTLAAFNKTMAQLEDGKSQLDLDVKVIQLAHVSAKETGTTFFQQTGIYNVYSEINSILSQNQSLVQQIISAGLVPNASTLANQVEIIAILVASGQLTGTPFNQGFLPFGGGLTQNIIAPGPATLTMSLNTSDTRMLDDIHMRLADQEDGTFKIGQRYPIETSSYSSAELPTIPGITTATTSLQSETIPQVQYEDLGLTFKATPKVMRSDDVALKIDLKIESLGGSSVNDIPILNSQQVSGVLTLKAGETAVLISDLSRSESRALSGLPGVSDIPGFEDISDIARNQNVARLLILVTPSVTRNLQQMGHGPMLMVDKAQNSQSN
jgi:general secretion pathway protein D